MKEPLNLQCRTNIYLTKKHPGLDIISKIKLIPRIIFCTDKCVHFIFLLICLVTISSLQFLACSFLFFLNFGGTAEIFAESNTASYIVRLKIISPFLLSTPVLYPITQYFIFCHSITVNMVSNLFQRYYVLGYNITFYRQCQYPYFLFSTILEIILKMLFKWT